MYIVSLKSGTASRQQMTVGDCVVCEDTFSVKLKKVSFVRSENEHNKPFDSEVDEPGKWEGPGVAFLCPIDGEYRSCDGEH
jgi:hypothetical protein